MNETREGSFEEGVDSGEAEAKRGKRGFKVDKEKGEMAVRGLKLGSIMDVFQSLLEQNPEMSLREAIEQIGARQKQGEELSKKKSS